MASFLKDDLDVQFPSLYCDLKRIAQCKLAHERVDLTLSATDLVHEVYQRLSKDQQAKFASQTHFIAICSLYMRRVLVDYARKRTAKKRGGKLERVDMEEAMSAMEVDYETILDVHAALNQLECMRPDLAKLVEYRFFGGMTYEAIAIANDTSVITAKRKWALAKAHLLKLLSHA